MTEHERMVRSERARQLLDDAVLKDALASIEQAEYEKLLAAPDDKIREHIDRINVIRGLRSQLSVWIVDRPRQQVGIA